MRKIFVLLLLISYGSRGDSSQCIPDDTIDMKEDFTTCVEADDAILGNFTSGVKNISIMSDTSKSEFKVLFPVTEENTIYFLTFFVNENITTKEECNKINEEATILHSLQVFNISKCRNAGLNHSKPWVGSVTFKHIYSGCYWVKIHLEKTNQFLRSDPKAVNTTHLKKIIQTINPNISVQCFPSETRNDTVRLNLTIQHRTMFDERIPLRLSLQRREKDTSCTIREDGNKLAFWRLSLTDENALECRKKDVDTSYTCELREGRIICVFDNMEKGNYCLTVTLVDAVRCSYGTLWANQPCIKYLNFGLMQVIERRPLKLIGEIDSSRNLILGLGIALVALLCIFLMYINCKKRKTVHQPIPTCVPRVDGSSEARILLLYAQECEAFMKMMVSFRELLTKVGKCQVLDCFDPEYAEEIASSPVEWIHHCVSSPDVKVIVVASNCSLAQQEALLSGTTLQYKEPLPNSNLFLYGLKEVMYNHSKADYTSTFVIRFGDEDLQYLTPYIRYKLPQHISQLLGDLNPNVEYCQTKEEEKLTMDCAELNNFKIQNPHYASKLLMKVQETV